MLLLNDKEFCFSLIGLNSIFSTLPQSEYTSRVVSTTSREVYSGLFLFLSIVYSVFQSCPTRDEISFPIGKSNCKKVQNFKISKFKLKKKKIKMFIKCQNLQNCYKISKIFIIFQNFHHISKF